MSVTYTWKAPTLDSVVATGYVFCAHWTCTAVDGEHTASAYATVSWAEGTPVIAYENLTQEIVLNWVWENIDKSATEASLEAQIALLKNPVKATGTPWGQA
jgi:hypothetical protein